LLKDQRIDPNVDDNFPLNSALGSQCFDLIKLLLDDPRVHPNIDEDSLFYENLEIFGDSSSDDDSEDETTRIAKLLLTHPRVPDEVKARIIQFKR